MGLEVDSSEGNIQFRHSWLLMRRYGVHQIHQRYDCIFVAGTGYGNSLIFHGLAAPDKRRVVIYMPIKGVVSE